MLMYNYLAYKKSTTYRISLLLSYKYSADYEQTKYNLSHAESMRPMYYNSNVNIILHSSHIYFSMWLMLI